MLFPDLSTPIPLAIPILSILRLTPMYDSNTSASTTSASATSSPVSTTSSSQSASQVGAIAGGVVGGVVAVAALLTTIVLCRRRRRRSDDTHHTVRENTIEAQQSAQPVSAVVSVEPYTLAASDSSRTKGAASSSLGYLDTPSASRAAESTSESAVASPVRELQDEDVLTVSAFRRLLTSLVQEHTQESAPPEYSSRAG